MNGPYIYRKPIGDEVLEYPFRVPDAIKNDGDTEDVKYWHFYFEEWNYCHMSKLEDGDIWEPSEVPPPVKLLEMARILRKEP